MATKNVVRTLIEDSRRISLSVADAASGDNAGHLVAVVHLDTDGGPGHGESVSLMVTGPNQSAGLTAQERSDFVALSQKIYAAGKAAAGYV